MDDSVAQPLMAVDVGNSSIHFGLFPGGETADLPVPALWFRLNSRDGDFTSLLAWLPPRCPPWVVASVNPEETDRLLAEVRPHHPDVPHRLLDYTQLPLRLAIERPQTAGLDRLAAAVAVNRLRAPGQPAVVVDFGTAITVDAVSADGTFLGGAILPGMDLAMTSLVAGTSQLPPVDTEFSMAPAAIGPSTGPAIRAGLFWGAVGAVRQLIEKAAGELGVRPLVVSTGGAAEVLSPHLDAAGEVIHVPHLVLSGIAVTARSNS